MSKVMKKIERNVNGATKITEYRVGCKGCKHLLRGGNFYTDVDDYRCAVSFYQSFNPLTGTLERYNRQLISIANKNGGCKKRQEFKSQ